VEVTASLRRGIVLRGQLFGPDGKPVPREPFFKAAMLYGRHPHFLQYAPLTARFRYPEHNEVDQRGRFRLRGCDPDRQYRLFFTGSGIYSYHWEGGTDADGVTNLQLHAFHVPPLNDLPGCTQKSVTSRWGAVVDVYPRETEGKPISVRLQECGSATVRFVDAQGTPVVNHKPGLQLVLTPGPSAQEALRQGCLAGEAVWLLDPARDELETQEPRPERDPTQADAEGRITCYGLIPGATYRLLPEGREDEPGVREFSVSAGENHWLPDTTIRR
jgi:hypothetical protein